MQKLNVLIVGDNYIDRIGNSKYLDKLFLTSEKEYKNSVTINFNTFQELADKCKALKIDLVIVEEEKYILQGIGDVLRANHVNCIAPSKFWTKLATSNFFAREMAQKFDILVPETILFPSEFPVYVRADGFCKQAKSLTEVVNIKNEIFNISSEIAQTTYIEKNVEGTIYKLISIYDGQNLLTFPNENFDIVIQKRYSKKLENMLNYENNAFTGLINSKIIFSNGKIYNLGFNFDFEIPNNNTDLLYIFISALYQKLNEIQL